MIDKSNPIKSGSVNRSGGSKTTKEQIAEYWFERPELEVNFNWDTVEQGTKICWRCESTYARLERCHIIPDSLGGKDEPSNLVLLCNHCHLEAPNCADHDFFLLWMNESGHPSFNKYEQAFKLFEKLYGRKPGSGLDQNVSISQEAIYDAMSRYQKKVSTHFGEQGFNIATMVYLLHRSEKQLIRRQERRIQQQLFND